MIYSSQQGLKLSICEFFKDLLSCDLNSEKKIDFYDLIYSQVIATFITFLAKNDDDEK